MNTKTSQPAAYAVCVPHLPFMTMQARELNAGFWKAYEARAAELRTFDPELVFVFGSDHYEGQVMRSMPAFMVGQAAEAVDDRGGFPGRLDVPGDIALACAEYLVDAEFDVATSYAMQVDHGFSNVVHQLFDAIDARRIVPIFVNALSHPRPTFRRCRRFGEAVGHFAATLGKRVAFVGSGGLSHETGEIFPQVFAAPAAFAMAGLTPADVDLYTCYDPFTIVTLMQLEDSGFCEKGAGGEFVSGDTLHFDSGKLPTNTHGGLLSHAYVLGIAHVVEVVRQLRGEAAAQVPAAEVGIYGGYTGPQCSTLILRKGS